MRSTTLAAMDTMDTMVTMVMVMVMATGTAAEDSRSTLIEASEAAMVMADIRFVAAWESVTATPRKAIAARIMGAVATTEVDADIDRFRFRLFP